MRKYFKPCESNWAFIALGCLGVIAFTQTNLIATPLPQLSSGEEVAHTTYSSSTKDIAVTQVSCGASCGGGDCCQGSGCGKCCCCCKAVCCPKCVTEEVKKHCWLVKSELVCIPRFQFNLFANFCKYGNNDCGDCCSNGCCRCTSPSCGRVRCINVLEKHEYTCKECGYEWDVKCVRTGGVRCCGERCSCPSCGCVCERP